MTLSALSHGTFNFFYFPLPFVELDGIRLDVHGGVVSPEELKGVGAGHLLMVLYLYPRLGEVDENGQLGLVVETHVLLIEIDEVLFLDVCDKHGDADLRRGFLDVVCRPDGVVFLC